MTDHVHTVSGEPASVAEARRWVGSILHAAGCDAEAVWTARLVVSELVTNAVRHTASGRPGGKVRVGLTLGAGQLRLSVTDEGTCGGVAPGTECLPLDHDTGPDPHVLDPALDPPAGRGLTLVHRLAARVRVSDAEAGGRTVAADVPVLRRTYVPREEAIEQLLCALHARGMTPTHDSGRGMVTARHNGRAVAVLAGDHAWLSPLRGLAMPFGDEWLLSGRMGERLSGVPPRSVS